MKLPRRRFLHLAAGAAALPAVSRVARAQAYPSRPVFEGKSGPDMLRSSSSLRDPLRTSGVQYHRLSGCITACVPAD
jgi:hypothetical protein